LIPAFDYYDDCYDAGVGMAITEYEQLAHQALHSPSTCPRRSALTCAISLRNRHLFRDGLKRICSFLSQYSVNMQAIFSPIQSTFSPYYVNIQSMCIFIPWDGEVEIPIPVRYRGS
jgi:hypothetical protein